jgi:hypothetical protein
MESIFTILELSSKRLNFIGSKEYSKQKLQHDASRTFLEWTSKVVFFKTSTS